MSSIKEFQHLKISLQDLKSATNDFADSNCIGRGGFGKVYKGEIHLSGVLTMVAVKRLDRSHGQGTTEFWKEIMMLSRYKHKNLVSLLGFCDEGSESLLVYEYLSKKSLDLYLISNPNLSWDNRLFICVGAAEGLKFLHEPTEGSQHRVLHRDIKSANILLDDNLVPKISDLGLSKLGPANQQFTFVFSNAVGTMGYCDPSYAETGLLTKESDVYSFGVVLFEVLCGRPAYVQDYNDIRRFLTALVRKCYEEKKLDTIIHSGIRETISPKSLERFSATAYQCLHMERAERPSMAKIAEEISIAYLYQLLYESSLPELPLKEIEVATENFKTSFGKSQYCQMYIGELSISEKPTAVIVKRFAEHSGVVFKDFLWEIYRLCDQPHPNHMSVIGYCDKEKERIIVYEYPERGRLDQYIRRSSATSTTLMWLQRLKICIGAARGLYHLHDKFGTHDEFKSANILLDDKWDARVYNFVITAPSSTTDHAYKAPEYVINGKGSKEADVYSFGMVLFEVLCGRLCTEEVDGCMLSAKLIKELYEKKKLDEMVDPSLREQAIGSNSVEKYSAIAYRCLSDDPKERPSMDAVIKELEELLRIEIKDMSSLLELPSKEVEVATENFKTSFGESQYGQMYIGELSISEKPTAVIVKRFAEDSGVTFKDFLWEIYHLCDQPHPNHMSVIGYCYEERQRIIVYEYPERGRLDQFISRSNATSTTSLTWLQRLKICIGAAQGLYHLHRHDASHNEFKSANILLDYKWDARVYNFVMTAPSPTIIADHAYKAPEYVINGKGSKEADVYSFGMVLFEVLCGRLCTEDVDGCMLSGKLIKELYEKKKLDEMVDPSLKEQAIGSNSVEKYLAIAYRCLFDDPKKRPSMDAVIKELQELLRIKITDMSSLLELPSKEIEVATENFKTSFGESQYGQMYIGELSISEKPTAVIVKRFAEDSGVAFKDFLWEIYHLCDQPHPNHMSVIGYCYEERQRIIVYEYPERGRLDQYISRSNATSTTSLTWLQRLKICIGAAQGLYHLHRHDASHNEFKSANILLDDKWDARVYNFVMTAPSPTIIADHAYKAPEYVINGKGSKEADVYSFGMVLFEVLCGRLCTEDVDGCMLSGKLIKELYEKKKLDEMVDPSLREQATGSNYVEKYLTIAYRCLLDDPKERPSMDAVIKELEELLRIEELREETRVAEVPPTLEITITPNNIHQGACPPTPHNSETRNRLGFGRLLGIFFLLVILFGFGFSFWILLIK